MGSPEFQIMEAKASPGASNATPDVVYRNLLPKTSPDAVAAVVNEALGNSVDSALRYFGRLNGVEEESA